MTFTMDDYLQSSTSLGAEASPDSAAPHGVERAEQPSEPSGGGAENTTGAPEARNITIVDGKAKVADLRPHPFNERYYGKVKNNEAYKALFENIRADGISS